MSRRRLLVICHGFPPYYGGAEHAAGALAREAARSGRWDVAVLTSDLGGRLAREETTDGVRIHRVPARKKAWARHTGHELGCFYFAAARRMPVLARQFQPDHVLAHFSFPAGRLAQCLRRRLGIPYSVVLHGSDVPGYQPARFGPAYWFLRPVVRRVWHDADRVVAVSEELKRLAWQTLPGAAIEVIANGVDTGRFDPAGRAEAPAGTIRLVVVAQLIERKGIRYLLEALARLDPTARRRLPARIYGTGPEEAALKAQVRAAGLGETVTFHGLAPHAEIPAILREADVFVLPSLQEGLPLALLEAMASGLAIVATSAGGMGGVLRHEANALVVEPASASALAAALHRLAADPTLLRNLGKAARATALGYGWPAVWRQYEQLIGPVSPG